MVVDASTAAAPDGRKTAAQGCDDDRTSQVVGESPPRWSSGFEALAEKSYRDPHTTIAHLGFTGAVSTSQARALCCGNPELTAIVMADGIPIDVKPTARFATGALRKALIARDRGCQFPGCGTPPAWTQAHHIQHWADGGPTILSNLVLLCSRHHHTSIHTQGWEVTIGADGHPWFRPPHTTTERKDWMPCHQRRSHTLTLAA
ncbi:HNH endonuclease [Gordonia sp. X0973]|nr:HNH endonuclease [Gordonia sp. X0973]